MTDREMSNKTICDFLAGVETRVHTPDNPGEWDHERYLDYRRRMRARVDAHLARFVGAPTAMPPKPERPEFLSEPPDVDYRAKIQRRLRNIRESEAN